MEFFYNGLKLLQDENYFKLGLDSILIANFAKLKNNMKICDLGSGNGCIPILLLSRNKNLLIDGIEIQEELVSLANKNINLNNLNNKFRVFNEDLKDNSLKQGFYDMVISNPPYYSISSGDTSVSTFKKIARSETDCTLGDICLSASKLLKYGGSFNLVHKTDRLADIIYCLKSVNLEPKRIRLVMHTIHSESKIVLIEAKKYGNTGLKFARPLIIKDEDGNDTDEILEIYNRR